MGKLLDDIEAAATTSAEPLTDLLRRCKVLAARLKHAEFADWVSRELNGYEKDDDLPSYRQVPTPNSIGHFSGPMGSVAKNVPLPLINVPEEFREGLRTTAFRQSIAQLQELAKADTGLERPWDASLVAVLQSKFMAHMVLVSAHVAIPPGAFTGILDTVRTRVLDFVLGIKAENPDAGESPPNAASPPIRARTVTTVFHNTIIGGHANIGTSGNATIDNSDAYNSFLLDAERAAQLESLLSKARREAESLPDEEKEAALSTLNDVATAAKTNKLTAKDVVGWTTALSGVVNAGHVAAPHIMDLVHWLAQQAHLLAG